MEVKFDHFCGPRSFNLFKVSFISASLASCCEVRPSTNLRIRSHGSSNDLGVLTLSIKTATGVRGCGAFQTYHACGNGFGQFLLTPLRFCKWSAQNQDLGLPTKCGERHTVEIGQTFRQVTCENLLRSSAFLDCLSLSWHLCPWCDNLSHTLTQLSYTGEDIKIY